MPLPFTPQFCVVDESREHVMLVRFNRPKAMNSMPTAMHAELSRVFAYYDNEESLWVAIVTGNGRAFSAGFDLKEAAGISFIEPDLSGLDPSGVPDCQVTQPPNPYNPVLPTTAVTNLSGVNRVSWAALALLV
jgi:enoyl-CoA hydratase/carnithine racemase